MDTIEQMLSMLLDGAVETLDISPHLQQLAVERYEEVGTWLAEHGEPDWRIYPQGSFRLGTVVRPSTRTGEYDIDLVCRVPRRKGNITQAQLKQLLGDMLHAYLRWKTRQGHTDGPKSCESRRRCWTLEYPDHGFHLDVLPTIPDIEHPPTGILLTDQNLREWQHSNPIGYADWFKRRCEQGRSLVEAKRHHNVADVPDWTVRSTLQRIVQVLKWHCMLRFANDPDNRPPSILITTLAARAYRGEQNLFTGTRAALDGMTSFIENRHGKWWVPNPAHEEENFTDKWNEYPERRLAFIAWHRGIVTVLDDLAGLQGKGLQVIASRMSESFSAGPVFNSVESYGDRMRHSRETGALRMTSTGLLTTTATTGPRVRDHHFYGEHPDPRR
ncbi:nucleotidyltransferase domain-containing protein [Micromonospora noduli]|uniref:nucleotidyltransferase domain-containing protein n=1 Tax=Micromonospora noduli TaxID=709876 RepID=UPI000DC02EF1|nr:nucleotidyltransferase [Micromonospora noduli]RAO15036.1 hypothetical protein GUI43_02016 [Micromonospora noduli]